MRMLSLLVACLNISRASADPAPVQPFLQGGCGFSRVLDDCNETDSQAEQNAENQADVVCSPQKAKRVSDWELNESEDCRMVCAYARFTCVEP